MAMNNTKGRLFEPGNQAACGFGAPKGNRNSRRHGLYSPRLPKGLSYPDKKGNEFRRFVERAVLEAKGEVCLVDAALIHSAGELQKLAYKNRVECREAREKGELTHDLSLRFDAEYRRTLDMRDAKLKALGLDARELRENSLTSLYGPQTTLVDVDDSQEPTGPNAVSDTEKSSDGMAV